MLSYFSSASSIMRSLVAKGFFLRARRDCAVRPDHGETREHCAAGSLAAEEGGRGLVELARLLPAPLWRRRPVHARPAAIAAHQPGVHRELPASRSYIKLSACPAAPVYQLCVSDARAGPGHSRQRQTLAQLLCPVDVSCWQSDRVCIFESHPAGPRVYSPGVQYLSTVIFGIRSTTAYRIHFATRSP